MRVLNSQVAFTLFAFLQTCVAVPTPVPVPAPTFVPVPVPTLVPIPAPTPEPTVNPSIAPTMNPTPVPTGPTPLPSVNPTHTPTSLPTSKPTHIPTSNPTITPAPSATPNPTSLPTIPPTPSPSPIPTPRPSPVPTLTPTVSPSITTKPSFSPTFAPIPAPTSVPTTIDSYYPKYVVTLLVRCIQFDNTNLQGPSNHTYEMALTAGAGDEFRTQNPVVFNGLGYVDKDGQPIPYYDYKYNASAGDLSCDINEGGGSQEMALIYDYEIGSATTLDFLDGTSQPFGTGPEDIYELSKVCFKQMTAGDKPVDHDGLEIDVAVTQYDVAGTVTYVMNTTVDLHNIDIAGTEVCSHLHPLKYDIKYGGYNNQTVEDLKQNSIPFEAAINSEFDADITMLAFPYDDNTTRSSRAAITTQYGDRIISPTISGSYDRQTNPDYYYEMNVITRDIIGYELSTGWNSNKQQVSELCDSACVARGGEYKSWHITTVIEWNFTKSVGNPNSLWADTQTSTYGRPLRMYDERRYFAVSYDKTEPTYSFVQDSIKFKYANNASKCGRQYYDETGINFIHDDDLQILCTSTNDELMANFTANEEGAYYFYAHPSFDQNALEKNFSSLVGEAWPKPITALGLYTLHYACDEASLTTYSSCDSYGSFPRDIPIVIPMDAEAFIFGYDFSFSEFAIYGYVQDDGYVSENIAGNSINHAAGLDDFLATYGNQSYNMIDKELINYFEKTRNNDLFYQSNNYNMTEWADSRYVVVSSEDSDFRNVFTLKTDNNYTSSFGRRSKVTLSLNELANEYDYTSHRSKYYTQQMNDGGVERYQIENYLINTDSFYNEKVVKESTFYNITRDEEIETVFMIESSDPTEAIASSTPYGGEVGAIILGLKLTTRYSDNFFYMIGQGGNNRADQVDVPVKARLRLLYSNDPLFQFVPVLSVIEIELFNRHLGNVLLDSTSGEIDDTGATIDYALPVLNITAKNNIDYTTDQGGRCTLLVSLTNAPVGYVTFSVTIPDTSQAQIYQGKGSLLTFSPSNYEELEIEIEGLNDYDNSNGDVPYDVVFALVKSEDPTYLNRYSTFHFAQQLTNLATRSDVRLAVSINTTQCVTTEDGGTCDILVMVCAHNSMGGDDGNGATSCEAPFNTYPIFTNGIKKIAVSLNVSDRFESEITAIRSNGRFDASNSQINCNEGVLGENGGPHCGATVVFEPFSDSDTTSNDEQGPYYAWVTMTGQNDYVLDGKQQNDVSISGAKIARQNDVSTSDYVLYKSSVRVENIDTDYSQSIVLNRLPDSYAGFRYLDVYAGNSFDQAPRCETSESDDVGACPVTVKFDMGQLNNTVTTRNDDVECVKVTLELAYLFANSSLGITGDLSNDINLVMDHMKATLDKPLLRVGDVSHDYFNKTSTIIVSSEYTGVDLGNWVAADLLVPVTKYAWDRPWNYQDEVHSVFTLAEDYCIPPGNTTVEFNNATNQWKPSTSGAEGGWAASVRVSGTNTYLYSSSEEPVRQNGNYSIHIPTEGVPLFLNGEPQAGTVEINITTGSSSLSVYSLSNSSDAISDISVMKNNDYTTIIATFIASGEITFELDSSDDDIDDDDEEYEIMATVTDLTYGLMEGESRFTISSKSQQANMPVYHYDDDTAGFMFNALHTETYYAYRTDREGPSDFVGPGSGHTFSMTHNTTSESYELDSEGDPERVNSTSFNVSLTSQPRSDVVLKVTSPPVHNKWGWQLEGVPVGGYKVHSYASPSPWIEGTNDTVINSKSGGLELTFTSTNWNIAQSVTVIGLDDFLYDGDAHYHMKLSSTSSDLYYDSNSNVSESSYDANSYNTYGYMPPVIIPLVNKDDEEASFVAMQNGTQCSEPYFGYEAAVHMYLTSKPSGIVSVWLASSDPNEAMVGRELVAFTPDNWETMQEVSVTSIDDFVADGDIEFDVTIDLFHSADEDYDTEAMFDNYFNFTSVDDLDDTMGVGAAVQFEITSDKNYTTVEGGEVSIAVTLSYQPQAPVYVSVTTSNQNQAVLTTASTLVFTSSNYADIQTVTVQGVDDMLRDGDTFYSVILGLESTEDPYYARFAFSPDDHTVSYELVNHDYSYSRVRLATSIDTTMTYERDALSGSYASLTVGICEAIYGAVENNGVVGHQVTDLDSSLCGGYPLIQSSIFDEDNGVSFVVATIEISETNEAKLECESTAYQCSTNYNGQMATLRFDSDGYDTLLSFTSQLKVIGLNDFVNDDDNMYNITVSSATARYGSVGYDVLDSYLPKPLTMTNIDDEPSNEESNAWFSISPAVECSVFESNLDGSLPDNCILTLSFSDVTTEIIDAVNDAMGGTNTTDDTFAYVIGLNVSKGNSSVYLNSVSTSDLIFVDGNVSNPGDTDITLYFIDPTVRWNGNLTASIGLATVDDDYDDGDQPFTVDVYGLILYNCSDFITNGTGDGSDCAILGDFTNTTYTVQGMEYDDDNAGLEFTQSNQSFYSLRTDRNDGIDWETTSLRTIHLPSNTTSEDGVTYGMFGVKLSSKPEFDVTVTATAQFLSDEWGVNRVEGVPSMNMSTDGSAYQVIKYKSPAPWIENNRSKDKVSNQNGYGLMLTFTSDNWNKTQKVYVVGLDDLAADGDLDYNIYFNITGTENDKYHYDPMEKGFEQLTRVPFSNIDDEKSTVDWYTMQHGTKVAEPFYGYSSRISVYPLTEPSDVISLSFSSTRPDIANTSETLVTISPSDWDQVKNIYVNSVDNFLADGDIDFDVVMLNLGSSDAAYDQIIENMTFPFTKYDDPADLNYSDPIIGVGMEFATGINLYGVYQDFTTEYGGTGMYLDDVAKTGTSTVMARLTLKPQDTVTYSVAVSDTTEAQILYPSTVAFTSDNWNEYQEVVVIGRADTVADGDVTYDVQFNLLGTNDPYYAVLPLNRTSHSLINQDTVTQRVALGISSLACLNITEGTETTRGFSVSGRSECTVTLSLCLSDTEYCTQKLTEDEVYNISESLGIDSISIDVYMGDKSVARMAEPTSNMGQINVTNNGSFAHIQLAKGAPLSTTANLTVYATDDTLHDGKAVTSMLFYGVLQKEGIDVQDFVNYYDDEGDVTATTSLNGESVTTGSITVVARDDEIPTLRFYKTESCQTAEYGRINTPGQDVSDGTCLVYVRLGSPPTSVVNISIMSSNSSDGLFAMSYDADGTDSVDYNCTECPTEFTSYQSITFDSSNWDETRKIVLVGQDNVKVDGTKYYELIAKASSMDDRFDRVNVTLDFENLDDESEYLTVYQSQVKVGARTALNVDEAGYVNYACKSFSLNIDSDFLDTSTHVSTLTIISNDETEVLVGSSCNPDNGLYAQNYSVSADDASISATISSGYGVTFYYIGVDDDYDDGDIESSITIHVTKPSTSDTTEYTFYLTTYDDDSLIINNPEYDQQDENKFTSRSNGRHSLEIFEPYNWETVSADPSTNRTGLLTFSYPNADTWNSNLTDFVSATVLFTLTENVGQYNLAFTLSPSTLTTTCTTVRMNDLFSPSCTVVFESATDLFQVEVTALSDDVDRNGHKSFANITTTMEYNSRTTSGVLDGGTDTKSVWEQSVEIIIFEDDLAGLTLNQTNLTSTGEMTNYVYQNTAFRDFPRGRNQEQTDTVSSMMLPVSTTKESGGNITFSLALTSEPLVDTYVYVYAEQVARTDGSETRYEAIPWPSSYDWTKYHPIGDYASQQVEDVVELADSDEGNLQLTFTSTNWNDAQDVLIVGLNDLYDDSTVDYNIYITVASSNSTIDPYYNQIGMVTLPLENTDDDVAGLAAYWTSYSNGPVYGIVSEPYYGYDAYLYFYLTSKPTDTVLVTLVSSAPSEARSTVAVAAIGPSDWDSPQSSLIYGIDDAILDGTQNFTISLAVVYSSDSDYGTSDENTDGVAGRMTLDMDGYSLDDPTDSSATTCGVGETGKYGNPKSNCTTCPIGTFVEVPGDKTGCRMCPPGTFGAWGGSQAMGISEDYDGTLLAPGCLPCPNGTYSDGYGATSCTVCPEGKYCWPLATTTPKSQKPWEQWANSFDRRWTQVAAEPYSASIEFFGRIVNMNRDQYEAYLIVNSFVVWLIISAILLIIYLFAPHPIRDFMIRFLRHFDLFPRRHQIESKNEEYADRSYAPSGLGGVISIGLILLGLACTSIMFYIYTDFNTDVSSTLDVYNISFIDDVSIDVDVDVSFIGFSGCSNNTYILDYTEQGTPEMIVTGTSYRSKTTSYRCKDGDLDMSITLDKMQVVTNPKFNFKVEPHCTACTDSGETPLYSGNTVLECLPCAAASTQGFTYTVKASNSWGESPGVHGKDDNFVNGSEVPSSATDVFRGDTTTNVQVNFMPATYDNRQTAKKFETYRLVYAGTDLGSTQSFMGATDFYGSGSIASTPSNFFTWVKEDSWVDEDATNAVSFTLDMPLSTSALSVVIQNYTSFLDVCAQVGGILGLLAAIFLLAMSYVERGDDSQDWIGVFTKYVSTYARKQRAEMRQRWNPEPESWTMDNIDKMQRREEKREGGARKVEEAAVTNFKDLYSRNNVVGQQAHDGGGDDDDEDFSHEVDEFHGQL